ncbi:MAG: Holliday junction branch migration protein RuvA [Ruminococcaceae bacterium]|nr:Holliday junction branch migration protein RuvA [Oscillospiraceae bacterium]
MFYSINGILMTTTESFAVVDCGGVGFKLSVSTNTLSHLIHYGEKVCLFTHLSVREDALELFGFFTEEELDAFKLLIGVSGIGPKAALAILSVLTPGQLALAVTSGDAKSISRAQGVGGKTASRVILELKDKIGKTILPSDDEGGLVQAAPSPQNTSEARDALLVLGYKRAEAEAVLKKIDTDGMEVEEIIREALKRLMR